MISKTAIHALNAVLALAELPAGQFAGTAQIAQQIGAPSNYLGKLPKVLAEEGLLESSKGRGGGFRLVRPPAAISLYELLEPLEPLSRWNGCFLGRGVCSQDSSCPVHPRWGKVRDAYLEFLKETMLAELIRPKSVGAS